MIEYGFGAMQVNSGKVQKYIGMTLAFTTLGQGNITMLDSIDEIINTFDKSYPTGGGTKSSAAPDIIFKVDEDCKNLIPKKLWSFITWWRKY